MGKNSKDDKKYSDKHEKRINNSDDDKPRVKRLAIPEIIDAYSPKRRLKEPEIVFDEDIKPNSTTLEDDRDEDSKPKKQIQLKSKANFGLSGKLTEETNLFNGVIIKYNEPPDAKKPTEFWRLYPFKGKETLPVMHLHRQSGYLIGRDRKIADIPMDHPSISKQHAVLQFRQVQGVIRPYVIDLESANGSFLNNKRIGPKRYYELKETDMLRFGYSTREYVVMTNQTELDEDE